MELLHFRTVGIVELLYGDNFLRKLRPILHLIRAFFVNLEVIARDLLIGRNRNTLYAHAIDRVHLFVHRELSLLISQETIGVIGLKALAVVHLIALDLLGGLERHH